ncbi:hypothetical protein, partial [Streptomyces rochei]|uniref:hypothetical protein n=1 Tax=Streptomyces rochei TaxID=1928 RepID=UPI0033A2C214
MPQGGSRRGAPGRGSRRRTAGPRFLPRRSGVEEIAMAYSFSRPSAKRAARVLALERATDTAG